MISIFSASRAILAYFSFSGGIIPPSSSSLENKTPGSRVAYLVGSLGGAFSANRSIPLKTLKCQVRGVKKCFVGLTLIRRHKLTPTNCREDNDEN